MSENEFNLSFSECQMGSQYLSYKLWKSDLLFVIGNLLSITAVVSGRMV